MHLVNLTTAGIKRVFVLSIATFFYSFSIAQENSPYSRYGLGDVVPAQNTVNRAMGGISAGYADYFSLNFVNPASLGTVRKAIFDIGAEVDRRTLKSNNSPEKYTATNTLISYLQFGVPIASKKMIEKGNSWGVSFGIKPITRVNYKIEDRGRLSGIDSLHTFYEGNGGLNQATLSTGIKIKNLSFGITGGYSFGTRQYSTRLEFVNDSVIYYKSNSEVQSTFNGAAVSGGMQYDIKTKSGLIKLGAYANLSQKLSARESVINATYNFDGNGGIATIDTVLYVEGDKGKVVYPATYGIGFTNVTKNWLYGADFEMTNWDGYRYFETQDLVKNSWRIKTGFQYIPLKEGSSRRYLNVVQYRAGLYAGSDMVNIENSKRLEYGVTLGAGLPLTTQRFDFAIMNLGAEFAARGNKESKSIRENIMRFSIGVAINATWFQKRKYD